VRLLIDTHTFLWFVDDRSRLSAPARSLPEDGSQEILLSVASPCEMAIKAGLGQLSVTASPGLPFVAAAQQQLAATGVKVLTIQPEHALGVSILPQNIGHNDPFDRLLAVLSLMA
jgi:PIN domain nuclease of toxin-antitoxin system